MATEIKPCLLLQGCRHAAPHRFKVVDEGEGEGEEDDGACEAAVDDALCVAHSGVA